MKVQKSVLPVLLFVLGSFCWGQTPIFGDLPQYASYERLHSFLSLPPTQGGAIFVSRTLFANDPKLDKYLDINYDINLGITWVAVKYHRGNLSFNPSPNSLFPALSPTSFQPILYTSSSLGGITGYYNSSYDFRMASLYSDPIVSKLQNPGIEAFFEQITSPSLVLEASTSEEAGLSPGYSTKPGKINTHVALGVAHESNGQFLENTTDLQKIRSISDTLYDQSFASMGWNYLYVRWANEIPFFLEADQVLGILEYRWFVPGWGIQDATDITGTGIRQGGIWAYDGIRLGLLFQNLVRSVASGTYFRVQLVLPSLVDRNGTWLYTDLNIPIGVDLSAITEIHTFPVYWGLSLGTSRDPSWYFKNTVTFKVGVSFQTVFYVNDLDAAP